MKITRGKNIISFERVNYFYLGFVHAMMSILPKARFDLEVSPAKRSGIMDISSLK